jgi:hypothetical protein
MDMSKFNSTYPESWSKPVQRETNPNDVYVQLATVKSDVLPDYGTGANICKTTVPDVLRTQIKMPSLGEMLKTWDHLNDSLYKKLIKIKYHNA